MMDTVNQKLNTDSEKLEHFVKAVNNEIQKTISGIIGEAEASKKAVLESAVVESNRLANDKINENVKKVNSKYVRIVAKAELDCKKDVLIEREKLTYKVFENIKESLIAFRQKPQYIKYLISLVKSEEIKDGLTICLSSEDIKYSADIQKALDNTCEFKEDSSIKLGGLSLLYADQGILIDKTIDSALSEQKNFFNEKNCFSQS